MQIAVFDSGLGGMTVLHDLIKRMPDEDYIYYADTAHVPYGTKPKEEVRKYIFESMDFIVNQGVKAIVLKLEVSVFRAFISFVIINEFQ